MANMKKKKAILLTIQNQPSGRPGMGDSQPPKNKSDISAHIRKLSVFTATAMYGSATRSSIPPSAGPTTMTTLSSDRNSELAAVRFRSSTTSTSSAAAAGRYGVTHSDAATVVTSKTVSDAS